MRNFRVEARPEPISFVNKTDTDLCKQMRSQFARAQGEHSFMGHMKFDNNDTQFIKAAFKGNRRSRPQSWRKPTPWPQDKMVELSQAWVDAMGGGFRRRSCGCEEQHYALHLAYNVIIEYQRPALDHGEYNANTMSQGSNGLEVPLEINTPNASRAGRHATARYTEHSHARRRCLGQSQRRS